MISCNMSKLDKKMFLRNSIKIIKNLQAKINKSLLNNYNAFQLKIKRSRNRQKISKKVFFRRRKNIKNNMKYQNNTKNRKKTLKISQQSLYKQQKVMKNFSNNLNNKQSNKKGKTNKEFKKMMQRINS